MLRKFLGKFIKCNAITGRLLAEVSYKDPDNQLPDNILAAGMGVQTYLAEHKDNLDPATIAKFFRYANNFCTL